MSNITLDQTPLKSSISDDAIIAVAEGDKLKHITKGNLLAPVIGQINTKVGKSEKGVINGIATLDKYGKVPVSQMPVSTRSYKGSWDASTNTPHLQNGVGKLGDYYILSKSGAQDLGSGTIPFKIPAQVSYNGERWEYLPSEDTGRSVNVKYYGAKGDGIVDDTEAIQVAFDSTPDNTTLYFDEGTYKVSVVKFTNKKGVTLNFGGAVLKGELHVGTKGQADPAFDFQLKIIGLRSDLSEGGLLNRNAITLANFQNVSINSCIFKGSNNAIYIYPVDKIAGGLTSSLHGFRLSVSNCGTEVDTTKDATLRGINRFLFVDNVTTDVASMQHMVADFNVSNNLNIQCNVSNVVGYGVDGISMQNNTFFLSGGFFRSQIKERNVDMAAVTWVILSGNNLFEAGLESVLLQRITNATITGNNIAWPGQKNVNNGYGIRISGGGDREPTYSRITINGNVIALPSRAGIKLDAGTNYTTTIGNVISAPGNLGVYYGSGVYPQGSPLNTPLINSVPHYAGDVDSSCLQCLVVGNQCNEYDWNFPVDLGVSEFKRTVHFSNLGVSGLMENKGVLVSDLSSGTVDVSNLSNVTFNVPAGGTINTLTGANIGNLLYLYNISAPVTLINNSASMQLSNNIDAIIPQRGCITLRRTFGVWTEVSRTFSPNTISLNAGNALASTSPIGLFAQNGGSIGIGNGSSSSSAFSGLIRGIVNGTNTFGLAIVGQGAATYTVAPLLLRGADAAGTGSIATGKLISFQNGATEVAYMDVQGNLKPKNVTVTLDFGSVAANSELAGPSTIIFAEAAIGDKVVFSAPDTVGINYKAYVSAAGVITIKAINFTTGAIDPPSGSYSFSIIKN